MTMPDTNPDMMAIMASDNPMAAVIATLDVEQLEELRELITDEIDRRNA